jgi:hypothetical protein
MKAVIYDYETLSSVPAEAPVVAMSIYNFDMDRFTSNPYTLEEIVDNAGFYKFEVSEQVQKLGRKIDQRTLDWWMEQDKAVRDAMIVPKPDDISVTKLSEIFKSHYNKGDLVFTRGNTFDPIITDFMLKAMGMNPNLHHFADIRDTRSYIDGMSYGSNLINSFTPPELEGKPLNKHDPRVDIALDILRMQSLAKAIL